MIFLERTREGHLNQTNTVTLDYLKLGNIGETGLERRGETHNIMGFYERIYTILS